MREAAEADGVAGDGGGVAEVGKGALGLLICSIVLFAVTPCSPRSKPARCAARLSIQRACRFKGRGSNCRQRPRKRGWRRAMRKEASPLLMSPEAGTLFVSYPGFATATLEVCAGSPGDHLDVRLAPSSADERIVVSAAGADRVPAEPSSQFVVSLQDVQTAGSLSLDDILRQAPGFALYRRQGSLFANPTSQGVSLRGVGSNGASRAAVLLDGIPINDPFGGWVYWTQVPRVSIESAQVINGGASDMYGGGALGGVVNIESRPLRNAVCQRRDVLRKREHARWFV